MFTGLVQNMGKVLQLQKKRGETALCISCALPLQHFKKGASILVDGVCLTVEKTDLWKRHFWVTAVQETLKKTTLSSLTVGDPVHLEPSLTLQSPLGGHLVSGHVDFITKVLRPAPRLRLAVPVEFQKFFPSKGSVCIWGVSLTIAAVGKGWLEVALIPETLRVTKLGSLKKGSNVHVEVDLIARYLEHLYASSR